MSALAAAGCAWLRVATLATAASGRGWLGAVVARQAAGRNERCVSTGGFLTVQSTIALCAIVDCLFYALLYYTVTES